jgi:hypothetical protein
LDEVLDPASPEEEEDDDAGVSSASEGGHGMFERFPTKMRDRVFPPVAVICKSGKNISTPINVARTFNLLLITRVASHYIVSEIIAMLLLLLLQVLLLVMVLLVSRRRRRRAVGRDVAAAAAADEEAGGAGRGGRQAVSAAAAAEVAHADWRKGVIATCFDRTQTFERSPLAAFSIMACISRSWKKEAV